MFFLILLLLVYIPIVLSLDSIERAEIARTDPSAYIPANGVSTELSDQPDDEKKVEAEAAESDGVDKKDQKKAKKIKLRPYGIVKNDIFWDSRQCLGFRENDAIFWPLRFRPDVNGRDINAHPQFHILPIQTIVGVELIGPKIAKCVKALGLIEGDFAGTSDLLINQFRMRLAYIHLHFERSNSKLIFGQYWHPLFIIECFPEVLSFTYGEPFDCQSRQPQIRYTKKWEHAELVLTALTERDFKSFGPDPLLKPHVRPFIELFPIITSTEYKRNAVIPTLNAELRYINENFIFGGNIDYKRIVPRIVTNKNIKVTEHLDSFTTQLFMRISRGDWSGRFKFIFEQNGPPITMPGGYAIHTIDPVTDYRTYSNINWISAWVDTSYIIKRHNLVAGIYIAGAKNLGSRVPLFINPRTNRPVVYGLAEDIANLLRVSPRLVLYRKPFEFGVELEITRAAYGHPDRFARVHNLCPTTNFRLLITTLYVF